MPGCLQQFINHNGVLYKVYVMGDQVCGQQTCLLSRLRSGADCNVCTLCKCTVYACRYATYSCRISQAIMQYHTNVAFFQTVNSLSVPSILAKFDLIMYWQCMDRLSGRQGQITRSCIPLRSFQVVLCGMLET